MRKVALLLLASCIVLAGCAQAVIPAATPTPPPTAEPLPTAPATPAAAIPTPGEGSTYVLASLRQQAFGQATSYEVAAAPALKTYSLDPAKADNAEILNELAPAQQGALAKNGFLVVPAEAVQFYSVYKQASDNGDPVFVTTDAILHTLHILYDYTLRSVELSAFLDDLAQLDADMAMAAQEQMANSTGEAQGAAWRNLAYFSVASVLLDPSYAVPAAVADVVAKELALIEGHAGFAPSPIMGYEEDYSQYVPRGHYTRNAAFERYFKAMMWYGRMQFRLRPGDDAEALAKGRAETRQAILMTLALTDAAAELWTRIYETTCFFVGQADDLTAFDYQPLMEQTYGDRVALDALNDDAALDRFIDAAMALQSPRIVSSLVTDQEDPEVVTKGFRFMGQRFIPDSYILQQLVYDEVGTQSQPRLFPKGLDVTAVLGSERAYAILTSVYHEDQYEGYAEQVSKLEAEFAGLPADQWTENLYWNWLNVLHPLAEPVGEGYPAFMRSAAWADKDLNTFLGSWTELRHDTILYAKQSYTLRATGMMPQAEPAVGYVEPRPEVWARLAALVSQMRSGLDERGLLLDEFGTKLERMEALAASLQAISEKELAGTALDDGEVALLRGIGSTLESLVTFTDKTAQEITSEADSRVALVADVHTDTNSERVLEEGVGDVFRLYALVPQGAGTAIAIGGVFSYYEFTQPMSDRLTDEAWQALESKPPLPEWTGSYR